MKKVIIGKVQSEKHFTKDKFFDILSLADQLYCSWSTTSNELEVEKIYFSKNLALDLWKESLNQLQTSVWAFNELLRKNEDLEDLKIEINEASIIKTTEHLIQLDHRGKKEVIELFPSAQASLGVISNLVDFYI